MTTTTRFLAPLACAGFLSSCLLLGCSSSDSPSTSPTQPDPSAKQHKTDGNSWTFLVYMVADTDLEPFGLQDLTEMAKVGSAANLNIVVQADRSAGHTADPVGNLQNWETTKRLKVEKGSFSEVSDLGEANMGDPKVLSDFISWGVKTYPADRYALVFWDHGGAWPGFGGDESAEHDLLNLSELSEGISSGMKSAGLDQFALLGFDACLMATYETAMTLRPFGEYLLASEELEPGHGWNYENLALLRDQPTSGPVELGKKLIDGFKDQAETSGTSADITLSLLDLYRLDPLAEALSELATALKTSSPDDLGAIGKQSGQTLQFGKSPDPARSTHMVDLGNLMSRIGSSVPAHSDKTTAVTKALTEVVVHQERGPVQKEATGLSIYFPRAKHYYNADYAKLASTEIAPWRDFLSSYYDVSAQGGAPEFENPNKIATVEPTAEGLLISGQLKEGSALDVTHAGFSYGIVDTDDTMLVLGQLPATVSEVGLVSTVWDGSLVKVSQGNAEGHAFYSVETADPFVVLSIPFLYETTEGESSYVLMQQVMSATESQVTYYAFSEAGPGELTPAAGSTLSPLLLVVKGEEATWVQSSDNKFDGTQPISVKTERVTAGLQVYLELDVEDRAGNSDFVYYTGTM